MPTYVTLYRWTEQGIRGVKGTVDRAQQIVQGIEGAGGKVQTLLWTQGSYDVVSVADFPDEDTAMAWALRIAMAGNVRSETLRAFSADDMRRILGKLD